VADASIDVEVRVEEAQVLERGVHEYHDWDVRRGSDRREPIESREKGGPRTGIVIVVVEQLVQRSAGSRAKAFVEREPVRPGDAKQVRW
jgi:hypothetical protein